MKLTDPTPFSVGGIRLAAVESGIRYENRLDLVVVELKSGSIVSGVTTRNAFCAAPVQVLKTHLSQTEPRYFLINTGNANAGMGDIGLADAKKCCTALAELTGLDASNILPFSTGVIGEKLPAAKLITCLPDALAALDKDNWLAAATGILTTDTKPKLASRIICLEGEDVTISGFAKGAGMIKPNMATMLAYVFTDAQVDKAALDMLLSQCVDRSFNRITVDGDTSTNDCCMLVATAAATVSIEPEHENFEAFRQALMEVFLELATGLIKDAEGASKFVTVEVNGGESEQECLLVAYAVAESPLVKTALFASDPNWGRILAAVGRAGVPNLNIDAIEIFIGDTCIVAGGAVHPAYTEEAGQLVMDKAEVLIRIQLNRGLVNETVWTSDLSNEYVRINADYRS
ncbi:MAG: bifunctional glutamate N-acetyltransferase/amino-acid acetyltransferase ArgJ [Pseudohongiellaceae bacterium]